MTIPVKRIQRIAVAVKDLEATIERWKQIFGIEPFLYGIAREERYHWCAFEFGEGQCTMEFLSPWNDPDLEGIIGKSIKKRGEGLYMVTLNTGENADAVVDGMRAAGIEPTWGSVIWNDVKLNARWDQAESWQEHYVHPKYTNGVLFTLATIKDKPHQVDDATPDIKVPVAGTKKG